MLLDTIGQRLRARRQELGLTQAALARRAGVSPRFLVQLESGRGNISIQRLVEVCVPLKLSLEFLFRGLGPGQREKISLVGLRGAGKSSVGQALCAHLSIPFVEVDERVEDSAGMSLQELFELGGVERYRELELQAIEEILEQPGPVILAAGGSVVTSPQAWNLLREGTQTVWLRARAETHLARVTAQGDLRPMHGRPDALNDLNGILQARNPLYTMADLHLDTDALGIAGVVTELAELVGDGGRSA